MDAKKDKAGKAKPGTSKIGMGASKPAKAGKTGVGKRAKTGKMSKSAKLGKSAKPGTGKIGMGPASKPKK